METDHSGISDDVVTGKPRAASKNQSYSLVGGCCRGNYRYIFLFIMIFFNANLYICRNCIAEAVVWMYGDSQGRPTPALTEHGPILTAGFYFGYPVFQLFAGHFSGAYGAKPVIQCGVTFWCIVTILVVPVYWSSIGPDAALNPDYSATVFPVLICRVLVGMFEGLALPAQVVLFRRWLPPEELSTGNSLAKAGECCGCILVMGSYPLLAASYGWEAIMYVSGGFGLVWFAVFSVFVSSVPEQCRFVGKDEAAMIVAAREAETATSTTNNAQNSRPIGADPYPPSSDSSDEEERNASMSDVEQAELPLLTTTRSAPRDEEVLENQASRDATPKEPNTGLCSLPWTEILTNLPYISVVLVHISHNWAMFLFMSQLPTFLKTQYPTMTDETRSLYSMVPYVTVTIAAFIAGPIADFFIKAEYAHAKKCTSTIYDVRAGVTRIRKFLTFLAEVPQACTLMLISLPVIQESAFATMALVTLGITLGGFNNVAFYVGYGELSNKYCGHLLGVGGMLAATPGILGNMSVKLFGGDFSRVFLFAGAVQLVGCVPLLVWGDFRDQRFGEKGSTAKQDRDSASPASSSSPSPTSLWASVSARPDSIFNQDGCKK